MLKRRKITFRVHAIQRMFQRSISENEVRKVLEEGEVIESYKDDIPYPSQLILGWSGSRPIHVVVADNEKEDETVVVTVYEPTLAQWERDFKRRKK